MEEKSVKIKIVKPRIPKRVICSTCGMRQKFRKKKEHWKMVKDIDVNVTVLLRFKMVYAKCLNPPLLAGHLRNAMADFRKKLKEKGFYTQDLWECRCTNVPVWGSSYLRIWKIGPVRIIRLCRDF